MLAAAIAVVVVPPNAEPHSWTVFVVRLVDPASHPERAATIVGLEPADSNLDGGLMPAGLAIDVENQYLYRLIWKSKVGDSNLVHHECTEIVRSTADHLAIVVMTYFCLDNFSVPTYHRIDPTELHSHPVVEIDPVAHSGFVVVGWLKGCRVEPPIGAAVLLGTVLWGG